MASPTMPAPILDQPPASPERTAAVQPSADDQSMRTLAGPSDPAQTAGSLQVVEITLKTGQAIGQGLDILGQIHPQFAPLAQQITAMLRDGLRTVLEQGLGPSEPAMGAQGQGNPMSGLATMTQGMPMQEEDSPPQQAAY